MTLLYSLCLSPDSVKRGCLGEPRCLRGGPQWREQTVVVSQRSRRQYQKEEAGLGSESENRKNIKRTELNQSAKIIDVMKVET